jgi:nucleoside-diphosphate-sugar epimerase
MAPDVLLIEADLQDLSALERLFAQHPIEAVIHLAALSVVSDSVAQPLRYYRENVGGLLNLLEAMHRAGVKQIVFSSTAAVYGISSFQLQKIVQRSRSIRMDGPSSSANGFWRIATLPTASILSRCATSMLLGPRNPLAKLTTQKRT